MEVLLDNVCTLCEVVTTVLTPHCVAPYIKYLYSTFFDKNNDALQEFQANVSTGVMCTLCSHQVVIAHKFKDSYEDVCKRSSAYKKTTTGCFLCEQKGVDLIETDTNPNDFFRKILTFMDTTLYPRSHLQCMVCFDCLFYLNIWYNVFSFIQKKLHTKLTEISFNNSSPSTRTKAQKKVHFNDDVVIDLNDSANMTEKKDSPSVRKGSPPPGPKTKRRRKAKPGLLLIKRKIGPKRSKATFKKMLKKQLKHLKTIKQIKKKWAPDIMKNPKIYLEVPYVLLSREQFKQSGAFNNMEREGSKTPDLIEISDSDEKSSESSKSSNSVKRKFGFKIKMSTSFLASSKAAAKNALNKFALNYTCGVCDKTLVSLSAYKMHALWHEKPEVPCVNVVRSNFSASADLPEPNRTETEETIEDNEDTQKHSNEEKKEVEENKVLDCIDKDKENTNDKSTSEKKVEESTGNVEETKNKEIEETSQEIEQTSETVKNLEGKDLNRIEEEVTETYTHISTEEKSKNVGDKTQVAEDHIEEIDESSAINVETHITDEHGGENNQQEADETEGASEGKHGEYESKLKKDSVEQEESETIQNEDGYKSKEAEHKIDDETITEGGGTNQEGDGTIQENENTHDNGGIEHENGQKDEYHQQENGDQNTDLEEYESEETNIAEGEVGTAQVNNEQDDFSDFECIDEVVDTSSPQCATDNSDLNDTNIQTDDQSIDSPIQSKKRNHDEDIEKDDSVIFENGDDDLRTSKRAKFSDNESDSTADCVQNSKKSDENAIET